MNTIGTNVNPLQNCNFQVKFKKLFKTKFKN